MIGAAACSDSGAPEGDDGSRQASEPAPAPSAEAPAPDGSAPSAESPASAPAPTPPAPAPSDVDWSGGDPGAGKQVYSLYCQTCHGASGAGDGPGAAALNPKPRDFTEGDFAYDPTGDGTTGEPADLAAVIQNGAAAYGGSPNMAPWGAAMTDQQVRDVIAYVQSLSQGS